MLNDSRKIKKEFLFFEPALQEGDGYNVVPHQTSILNLADGAVEINIPKGVNAVMLQALTQSVTYTLSGTNPTATSGFVLTAGNDPVIRFLSPRTKLKVHAAANGARLELQFGIV